MCVWYQCLKQNIEYPSITDRGWEKAEYGIWPIWFTCSQLPLSLSKEKSQKSLKQCKYTEYTKYLIINLNTYHKIHPVYSDCH